MYSWNIITRKTKTKVIEHPKSQYPSGIPYDHISSVFNCKVGAVHNLSDSHSRTKSSTVVLPHGVGNDYMYRGNTLHEWTHLLCTIRTNIPVLLTNRTTIWTRRCWATLTRRCLAILTRRCWWIWTRRCWATWTGRCRARHTKKKGKTEKNKHSRFKQRISPYFL